MDLSVVLFTSDRGITSAAAADGWTTTPIETFLLSDDASLLVGSVVFADGGTDALLHPLEPRGMDVPKIVLGAMDALGSAVTKVKAAQALIRSGTTGCRAARAVS